MNTVIVPNVTLPEVCRSNSLVFQVAITTVFTSIISARFRFSSRHFRSDMSFQVADHFVLAYRTSTRSSTSTARRSGTTKRLFRSLLKDGARANGHLDLSGWLLYTTVVVTKGESCWWACHCDYRRFVHSIRCSDKESIGIRSLHFICHM
jgi:hypothetical protein